MFILEKRERERERDTGYEAQPPSPEAGPSV